MKRQTLSHAGKRRPCYTVYHVVLYAKLTSASASQLQEVGTHTLFRNLFGNIRSFGVIKNLGPA